MKNIKTHAWRLLGVVALLMVMSAGCADGELAMPQNLDIIPPTPVIIKFAAEPASIKAGATTQIVWEVAGADKVTITAASEAGDPVSFNVDTEELSGTAPATLGSTTNFVLTATKTADSPETTAEEGSDAAAQMTKGGQIEFGPEPGAPAPSTAPAISEISQTITVTVDTATALTATVDADKTKVDACDQTVIRWDVTPSENVSVTVVADTGEQFSVTDQCDGSIDDIIGQIAVDPVPAKGCAVVAPCEDTTYTVTATDASGETAMDSATVEIDGDVTARIMAAHDETSTPEDTLLKVESFVQPVIISWTAAPDKAKVTVSASPSATCTPELPVAAEGQATGSASCVISGETTFTITAALGSSKTAEDKVIVTAGGGAAGLLVSDLWAFEKEEIELEMKLTPMSNPTSVAKLLVNGSTIDASKLQTLKSGSAIKIMTTATVPHVKIQLIDSANNEMYSTEKVQVIELNTKGLGLMKYDGAIIPESRVSSIAFDQDGGTFYTGVEFDYAGAGSKFPGIARIYKNHAPIDFNFIDPIKGAGSLDWNDGFFFDMAHYPVAVAVRGGHSDEIYAGVTGAIMRSTDGGESWSPIMSRSARRETDKYAASTHPTCGRGEDGAQKTMKQRSANFQNDFVSLNQTCDIIALESGRVIAAMDFGVIVEKDVENGKDVWVGIPADGVDRVELGALTFGHVVNDLIEADGKIFAATDTQVFVSSAEQGGIGWSEFGEQIGPVWALDYDARNKKIYAATEDGLFVSSVDSPSWTSAGITEPVISVAVDPKSPVGQVAIVAGTPTGAKITRNNGETWNTLALTGGDQAVEHVAIVAREVGGNVKYGVAFGADSGELFQEVTVGAQTIEAAEEAATSLSKSVITVPNQMSQASSAVIQKMQ
jgi:hypothetical protein